MANLDTSLILRNLTCEFDGLLRVTAVLVKRLGYGYGSNDSQVSLVDITDYLYQGYLSSFCNILEYRQCNYNNCVLYLLCIFFKKVSCLTPAHPLGLSVLRLSSNGQQFSKSFSNYEYVPTVTITRIQPIRTFLMGGTSMGL